MTVRRIVVGISGGSGPQFGARLLEVLRRLGGFETHLIVTAGAARCLRLEMPSLPLADLEKLADVVHDDRDLAAAVSSGSFLHDGMVVVPASMKTVSNIAYGNSWNLLVRAADVTLKERRPLVVVPRESPLHLGHLRALTALAEIGAVIVPPMVAFYTAPRSIDDVVDHVVGKILDVLRIPHDLFPRWEGPGGAHS
jgi:polyprenyl P-hydroxybenzoate/phenylacrylic acid decarboxylase-like protein